MARRSKSKHRNRAGDFLAVLLFLAFVALFIGSWWRQHHPQPEAARTASPTPPRLAATAAQPKPLSLPPVPPPMVQRSPSGDIAPITVKSNPQVLNLSSNGFPRPVHGGLEMQIALARLGISPGSVDGAIGSQTRAALRAFQRSRHLPETGSLDSDTKASLTLDHPLLTTYTVTTNDLAHLQPLGKTWLEKSQQSALDYETILELVAEKAHSHPALIKQLNPTVDWNHVSANTVLQIPDIEYPDDPEKAAVVVIHLSDKYLEAFDEETNLLVHFPCSIAARVEKRPVGELHVEAIAPNPNYTFDPAVFPESPEAQAIGHKLVLPPGPNNPVGVAWVGLDKPGYGIHGTPSPEQIGHTESHGCFRLANWDAAYFVKLAWIGLPVEVVP